MIVLEFNTADPDEIELCRRYWQLDGKGAFKESKQAFLTFDGAGRVRDLDRYLFASVTARDTRRRCPTCGVPEIVSNRDSYLAPETPVQPCSTCDYVNWHLGRSSRAQSDDLTSALTFSGNFRYPVASMALLHALGKVVQRRELHEGFSVHDCEGFAPAHVNRFLHRLSATHVIEKVEGVATAQDKRVAVTFRLNNDSALEQEFAEFKRLLHNGTSFDHRGLMEVWLDYAVAESVAFICGQAAFFGLPIDPEDKKLCSVLRTATSRYSIGEVWAISRLAIGEAATMVEHGSTSQDAAATISRRIARLCRPSKQRPIPEPILKDIRERRTRLREWFNDWYGLFEHMRGPVIADLFQGMHNTRTPHLDNKKCLESS